VYVIKLRILIALKDKHAYIIIQYTKMIYALSYFPQCTKYTIKKRFVERQNSHKIANDTRLHKYFRILILLKFNYNSNVHQMLYVNFVSNLQIDLNMQQ